MKNWRQRMSNKLFGEKALELLRELKRAPDGQIPQYNEDIIRQVLEEMGHLYSENLKEVRATTSDGVEGLFSGIQLRHAALERNQRCLLAYIHHRMSLIRSLRWDFGTVLPEELRHNLCEAELQWFLRYNKSLASYMRSVGSEGMDLTLYRHPPKGLYVEVRCVVDHGELETEDGTVVQLKKGSQHLLLRSQCEHLIRQGVLEHVCT